jgi:UDP-GlcNAc3NAcA epimerase
MSDVFFTELRIPKPDYHLDVHGGGHGAMTGAMMQRLEPILQKIQPDCVLIYGDTNSTLAGALVAAKLHIPIAHVEAGLRSFNRDMPEEINRIVVDQLAETLFASTETAAANLEREGVARERIHLVGDVMYDAALQFAEIAKQRDGLVKRLGLTPDGYVLATFHRAENTDVPVRLRAIVAALETVAKTLPVVLPLHPRTEERMKALGLAFDRVSVISPVGYLDMVTLEVQSAAIATDSGGVQKEAFFYGVPCVTMRDETEWVELVELGWNKIASPTANNLAETILGAIGSHGKDARPYGDGRAAEAIAATLA